MNIYQALLLGIVQGITEFLPISSSGHLVLVPFFFKWKIPLEQAFIFDVLVQVATLVGVFAYFQSDVRQIAHAMVKGLLERKPWNDSHSRLGWMLVLATIPAGVSGILIKPLLTQSFESPLATAVFLLITALLLMTSDRLSQHRRILEEMNWKDALMIGCFQILALFPGLSRSAATISGGLIRNLERREAARFSFLMSIPIMMAAGLLEMIDLVRLPQLPHLLPIFIPGFLAAAAVGYLSIRWLLGYLTKNTLAIFAAYCVLLSLSTLAALFIF
jgi:undecaprenyl-diphosphatase